VTALIRRPMSRDPVFWRALWWTEPKCARRPPSAPCARLHRREYSVAKLTERLVRGKQRHRIRLCRPAGLGRARQSDSRLPHPGLSRGPICAFSATQAPKGARGTNFQPFPGQACPKREELFPEGHQLSLWLKFLPGEMIYPQKSMAQNQPESKVYPVSGKSLSQAASPIIVRIPDMKKARRCEPFGIKLRFSQWKTASA
jgi:hypothetical protein